MLAAICHSDDAVLVAASVAAAGGDGGRSDRETEKQVVCQLLQRQHIGRVTRR